MNINNPRLTKLCQKTGAIFLTSQAVAAFGSLYHSIFKAPAGKEFSDFFHEFGQRSLNDGISMSTWQILNTLIEPHVQSRINSPVAQSITTSVLTSSLMSIRNGPKAIAKNFVDGFAQTLFITFIESGLSYAARPIDEQMLKRNDKAFHRERSEYAIKSPTESLLSVFFNK